ncbi:MAG TPA: hypothetical protein IAC33_01535 [Candidatus Fimousia stercorigallinarum]|nr:hypothetical protein [Candidatus Fimousia stercorigallinarum]
MSTKLVEDENTVFEIDEECLREKAKQADEEKTVELDDLCHMQTCGKKKNGCNHCWLIVLLFCICCR